MRHILLATALACTAAPVAATDCAALLTAKLPLAEVTGASLVPAGTPPLKPAVDVCRVTVTARPSADSDIRLELWIPQGAAWNGKFMQVGNGGFAGTIPYRLMNLGLAGGYAVAGTDNGHQSNDSRDASWALGHPQKVVDFGWRAVKTTTDTAKAVLRAYGAKLKHSYFFGCSDGGREALMSAQRYPADFDGIIAGAPAYNWTGLMAGGGIIGARLSQPGRDIPAAKLPAIQAAALMACGNGKAWIADPQACRFDPEAIACKDTETDECLTKDQLKTVRLIYSGVDDPATGKPLPGLVPGAEALPNSWGDWGLGKGETGADRNFSRSYFANVVRGDATLRLSQLTKDDYRRSENEQAATFNANSADLHKFRARGGKLIQFHGWNDPAISPGYSLAYAARLQSSHGDTSDFYRLYMIPGMLHCSGGAAPTNVNWIKQLEGWVEARRAPGTVIANAADGSTQSLSAQPSRPAGKAASR